MKSIHAFGVAGCLLAISPATGFAQIQFDIQPAAQKPADPNVPSHDDDDLNALLRGVVKRSDDRKTRYVVPSGDVKTLTEFLRTLSQYQPQDVVDIGEHRKRFRQAMQEAAERILKLEKDRNSEAYEAARLVVLGNHVYWFARATAAEQRRIIADVKDYLDEQLKKGNTYLATHVAELAARAIQRTGQWDWAIETYESFAQRAKKGHDEEAARWADAMCDDADRLRAACKGAPKPLSAETSPKGKLTPIDLSKNANQGITDWEGGAFTGHGLTELGTGDQVFGGVKFTITEKKLQLGHAERGDAASKIEGIAVGKKVRRLYFFQGNMWGTPGTVRDGTLLAEYKVHYADGSKASIPIAFGLDVRDWFDRDDGLPVTRGRVAWTGLDQVAVNNNCTIRLYLGVWENPHPKKMVVDLDFVRSDDKICGPFCLAITAEE